MATRGVVPVQGFEPRSSASKAAVLPLDDTGAEPSEGVEPTSLVYEASALPLCYEGSSADYGSCTRTFRLEA